MPFDYDILKELMHVIECYVDLVLHRDGMMFWLSYVWLTDGQNPSDFDEKPGPGAVETDKMVKTMSYQDGCRRYLYCEDLWSIMNHEL